MIELFEVQQWRERDGVWLKNKFVPDVCLDIMIVVADILRGIRVVLNEWRDADIQWLLQYMEDDLNGGISVLRSCILDGQHPGRVCRVFSAITSHPKFHRVVYTLCNMAAEGAEFDPTDKWDLLADKALHDRVAAAAPHRKYVE